MKSIFINKDSQLRSGWKILSVFATIFISFIILSIILGIIIQIALNGAGSKSIQNELLKSEWATLFNVIIMDGFFILIPIIFWKLLDKKPVRNMGLINFKEGYKDFIFGLAFGAVSITIVFAILLNFGGIALINNFSKPNITISILTGLIMFIIVGFAEEIFNRGYCMTVLNQTKNKWFVVIVSSMIFSALHAGNANVKPLAFINIFLVGVLFAYMFLKSSNIWMPIGYHITWNYFQGNIWGFQVSGGETKGLYQTKILQENILNGGLFGPEGGLIVTFILLLSFIVVKEYYKNKNIKKLL